jgi:DNA repair exonuclease SbcCD ATPase subunit
MVMKSNRKKHQEYKADFAVVLVFFCILAVLMFIQAANSTEKITESGKAITPEELHKKVSEKLKLNEGRLNNFRQQLSDLNREIENKQSSFKQMSSVEGSDLKTLELRLAQLNRQRAKYENILRRLNELRKEVSASNLNQEHLRQLKEEIEELRKKQKKEQQRISKENNIFHVESLPGVTAGTQVVFAECRKEKIILQPHRPEKNRRLTTKQRFRQQDQDLPEILLRLAV